MENLWEGSLFVKNKINRQVSPLSSELSCRSKHGQGKYIHIRYAIQLHFLSFE